MGRRASIGQIPLFDVAPDRSAVLSSDGLYRYELTRLWGDGTRFCVFLLLNPSTADATKDDPTVVRCRRYAEGWGYDGLAICNLYSFRATHPKRLREVDDPVGPENDAYLRKWIRWAELIVCGWGVMALGQARIDHVLAMMEAEGKVPHYLKLTNSGRPGHPLRLRGDLKPQPMILEEA